MNLAGEGYSYDKVLSDLITQMSYLYTKHQYLLPYLDNNSKKKFQKYVDENINESQLVIGIKFLSQLLYNHFQKSPFIFIDEYDSYINNMFLNSNTSTTDMEKILSLFRQFFEKSFKSNKNIEKGIITGVLRIAKANIFSGMNNIKEYNINSPVYAPYYGFTEVEVNTLLSIYNVPTTLQNEIKRWYNGYVSNGTKLYSPWSIVNVLGMLNTESNNNPDEISSLVIKNYWSETASMKFTQKIFQYPGIRNKFKLLLSGKSIRFDLYSEFTSSDFEILQKLLNEKNEPILTIRPYQLDTFFSFLYQLGYLTIDTTSKVGSFYKFPNTEIQNYLRNKLLEHYSRTYYFDVTDLQNITDMFIQFINSSESNRQLLVPELTNSISTLLNTFPKLEKLDEESLFNDISMKNEPIVYGNEAFIHFLFANISFLIPELKLMGSEVITTSGKRCDIMFITKNNIGVIMEIKYNDKDATAALKQIKDRDYGKELNKKYPVLSIGINITENKVVDIQYDYQLLSKE